jgi:hypothetical protein
MKFDTSKYLRRSTGRAKSDVANKLISMFLHEVSRKLCGDFGLFVTDKRYCDAVHDAFGSTCCYCGKSLEADRAAVEHPDGMNRFRIGLHIPGNVIVSCTRCNREKRRDDSVPVLILAATGWESFLCHNANGCRGACKSCDYWGTLWPDPSERAMNLMTARKKISSFRTDYESLLDTNKKARESLAATVDAMYRDCQNFATNRIKESVETILRELS